ncbi:MAG: hypothetical protein HRU75_09310 [Planctomycetia bacterium]|nr:MAG: hypothetical protein HRU75_09310 [Planctomycetia bacterium]
MKHAIQGREALHGRHPDGGFTLIEATAVLIVVALLAGAIAVGRELVRDATIRKAVSQVQNVQAAVAMFNSRYNALPGDFQRASKYWAEQGAVDGDGDGRISGGYEVAGQPANTESLESYNTWSHLALSGQFASNPAPVTSSSQQVALPGVIARSYLNLHFEESGAQGYGAGGNYITILGTPRPMTRDGYKGLLSGLLVSSNRSPMRMLRSLIIADAGAFTPPPKGKEQSSAGARDGLLPADAQKLDTKMDDALPLTGAVISALPKDRDATKSCVDTTGANAYLASSSYFVCGVWIHLGMSK